LLSAILKHYHHQGAQTEDLPIVRYASLYCLFEIQERFDEIIKNVPNRLLAILLQVILFPWGQRFSKPNDKIKHKLAQLLMEPTETRQRLTAGAFLTPINQNSMADIQDALIKVIAAEPIEKIIKAAAKEAKVSGYTLCEQAQSALKNTIITAAEYDLFEQANTARKKVLIVDDFDPNALLHHAQI
jgi:acyl-CoA dehydrogenase